MNLLQVEKRKIQINATISDALKQMDLHDSKLLIVTKNSSFFSLISIGDIQRAIINNFSLDTEINKILRPKIDVAFKSEPIDSIKNRMLSGRSELMPIIDDNGELVDVIFWEDIFHEKKPSKFQLNLPVVIMAGGKGTRLKPLTNVIPKPLIPIGDSTIIEEIMDRFIEIGSNNFLLSVNYKADTIRHYFDQLQNDKYKISYFQENKPLGTAGSLYLIKERITTSFFVSNCDIIINEDYSEIYEYHRKYNNELTIVSALKHYPIPYGIIETKENGELTKITEKPELNYQINSGMYILEPHLLNEIPDNVFFHITQLIETIINRNGKVGVFPVSEKSWIDIGDWAEYIKRFSK
ncbi:MAG: nucleotidyltransferase family protein [Melioribacteraceae bacterium]